jgi:5-methylcytosine-specific restriction endonuclease McrA
MTSRRRSDLTGASHRKRRVDAIRASGGICCLCGKPMRLDLPGTHPEGPTLEHLIPVARGGDPADPRNLSASHMLCNSKRGNRLLSEMPRQEQPSRNW